MEPEDLWPALCVRLRQSAPAAGVGLWPLGPVSPCAINWTAGEATGQTGCLSPAAGGLPVVHTCIYLYIDIDSHTRSH